MKTLKCGGVGFDCAAVVTAETVEEVLAQTAAHAQEAYCVAVTAEMAKEIEKKIRG
jgi:predicted small metal-binding protein